MPSIIFITHDGVEKEVHVEIGTSIMQAAVDNGIDAIVAECGGSCSCATCHCYIDDEWLSRVGESVGMEDDLLDCVMERAPNSRLSCQIEMTEDLDGIIIRLPESQY